MYHAIAIFVITTGATRYYSYCYYYYTPCYCIILIQLLLLILWKLFHSTLLHRRRFIGTSFRGVNPPCQQWVAPFAVELARLTCAKSLAVRQAVARAAGDLAESGVASFAQLLPLWALLAEGQPASVRVAFLYACPPVLRALATPPLPTQPAPAPAAGAAAAPAALAARAAVRAERARAMAAAREPVSLVIGSLASRHAPTVAAAAEALPAMLDGVRPPMCALISAGGGGGGEDTDGGDEALTAAEAESLAVACAELVEYAAGLLARLRAKGKAAAEAAAEAGTDGAAEATDDDGCAELELRLALQLAVVRAVEARPFEATAVGGALAALLAEAADGAAHHNVRVSAHGHIRALAVAYAGGSVRALAGRLDEQIAQLVVGGLPADESALLALAATMGAEPAAALRLCAPAALGLLLMRGGAQGQALAEQRRREASRGGGAEEAGAAAAIPALETLEAVAVRLGFEDGGTLEL
ncbi:hypothetical protein T492DRAFT_495127 [Pavlovales sp. CCMP2436]|nr:hypothetical protein T492DRAFT_495127 [Pavlovales sp. CCMP2436]